MSDGLKQLANETAKVRMVVGCCTVMALAISGSWCGLYWSMWSEAQDYNDDAEKIGYKGDTPAYDMCGLMGAADPEYDTKWTVLLAFNSILFLSLSICTLLLFLGSFFPPLLCCGCCGHTFGGCAMLACVIVTGVFRFQSEGEKCADKGGELFEDHGKKIMDLFISQCVLYFFYSCCIGFNLQLSIMAGGMGMMGFMARHQQGR